MIRYFIQMIVPQKTPPAQGKDPGSAEQLRTMAINKDLKEGECRICLQTQAQNSLIVPCKCSGTMRYVHQKCLITWLNTVVTKASKKVLGDTAYIYCQLCHGKIRFKIEKRCSCRNKEQIKQIIADKKRTFIGLLLLALANLAIFLTLLAYVVRSNGFVRNTGAVLFPLMISGLIIFSLVTLVSVWILLNKFFISKQFTILKILQRNPKY